MKKRKQPEQPPRFVLMRNKPMPVKWLFYRHKKTGMRMVVSKTIMNRLNKKGVIAAYSPNGQWLWVGTRVQFWRQFK